MLDTENKHQSCQRPLNGISLGMTVAGCETECINLAKHVRKKSMTPYVRVCRQLELGGHAAGPQSTGHRTDLG